MGAVVSGVDADRVRLDQALVRRGLASTRQRGQALIRAGLVSVDGATAEHTDQLVTPASAVAVRGQPRYVSRGGEKLAAALDAFGLEPRGRTCLDVGASTGGFTDVLLQRGAAHVIAVDVGYGQLAWAIRQDPRVRVLERVNIRALTELPMPADLAAIDVSFISLQRVLPVVRRLLNPPGDVVCLVKPQFEVGKGQVGKGGIVRDPAAHRQVLDTLTAFSRSLGLRPLGETASPILGARGNREFFLYLRPDG